MNINDIEIGTSAESPRKKPSLPHTSPYTFKDQQKWDRANKMIGRGSARSSTHRYAQALGSLANCGSYQASDVVFVSAEGNRGGRIGTDFSELQRAIDAGASFVTDVAAQRNTSYNIGEREVANFLMSKDYSDDGSGMWRKRGAR